MLFSYRKFRQPPRLDAQSRINIASSRLLLFFTGFLSLLTFSCSTSSINQTTSEPVKSLEFDDGTLQSAATTALGENEGTIIVIDPRDGRVRAVVNPRLAFEQTFPPGSTLKPFTALVAMRSGIADDETRIQCGRVYKRENYQVICSHKRINNSFRLHHAIAYSCNFYFSTIAEKMNAASFYSTLDSFGFGKRTGINATESEGEIKQSEWKISTAIGNDNNILVTPIQLLMAYSAMVNGGHLLRPRISAAGNFSAQEVKSLNLNPAQRKILIDGMSGCTQYGSASEAGFNGLPYDVIGKTGTSGASNGFRTQGWFVGFLLNQKSLKTVTPENLNLAVLVFLKRGHGGEAAMIASQFYRRLIFGAESSAQSEAKLSDDNSQSIKVHLVRENRTVAVGLENYVRGVLAAESSVETELEALKAQAIVSRTFALKNLRRHQADGYDFCSLTHCQRYVDQLSNHNKELIMRASDETAGQILSDDRGQVADVYFNAACGGMTTTLEAVWGVHSPSYLRSVKDDYCPTMAHKSWTQAISTTDLIRALQSDPRGNIGARLEEIVINKRDASGRAEFITIEGEKRKQVRGWEFALIVNRVLGWNMLKSARFEVTKAGSNFIFSGSGFGHGIGLCQEGAHVMARRGNGAHQIIDLYFPGIKYSTRPVNNQNSKLENFPSNLLLTSIPIVGIFNNFFFGQKIISLDRRIQSGNEIIRSCLLNRREMGKYFFELSIVNWPLRVDNLFSKPWSLRSQPSRTTVATEHFRLSSPVNLPKRDLDDALRTLESAYRELCQRLNAASINYSQRSLITVYFHESTREFIEATGQPSWSAGATRGNSIHLQPFSTLRKRGIIDQTLRHELAHAMLESGGSAHGSRWIIEGLAIHFAGEEKFYGASSNLSREELEKKLQAPSSAAEMRVLYATAARKVRELIREKGEAFVWKQAIKPS